MLYENLGRTSQEKTCYRIIFLSFPSTIYNITINPGSIFELYIILQAELRIKNRSLQNQNERTIVLHGLSPDSY